MKDKSRMASWVWVSSVLFVGVGCVSYKPLGSVFPMADGQYKAIATARTEGAALK